MEKIKLECTIDVMSYWKSTISIFIFFIQGEYLGYFKISSVFDVLWYFQG